MILKEIRDEKRIPHILKTLDSRNITAFYVKTKEEALKKALELIPKDSSIGWGGSMSIDEIGLKEVVKKQGFKVFNRSTATTPEEAEDIMRKILTCDCFLTSSNALSEDGILVNIDGHGNRVAAMSFGPKKIIMIIGMNKVVKTLDDAISRVRNIVAPTIVQKFNVTTPCKKNGSCYNCKNLDTICCQMLITRFNRHRDRLNIILVQEELGI